MRETRWLGARVPGVLLALLAPFSLGAAVTSPPMPRGVPAEIPVEIQPRAASAEGVTAVVVRSWGFHSDELVWRHLNANWSSYGATPVSIDYLSLHNANRVTIEALRASGADVVIVSNPAGAVRQWLEEEALALEEYVREGHNLVGTYKLFRWHEIDNRILAPLWGLRSDLVFGSDEIEASPAAELLAPLDCAFRSISNPMLGGGYPYVEIPHDDFSWDEADLDGAEFLARSESGLNIVTRHDATDYRAFYISYMPEFQDGSDVEATQWLYNVITCAAAPVSVEETRWASIKARFRD